MLLRVSLLALLILSSSVMGKHHSDDSDDHSHEISPSPDTAPPPEDWRKYVPPEYQHYIPQQPAEHPVESGDPNERARARYDPSYQKYGKPHYEHEDEESDKHHHHEKESSKHDKHDKESSKHDKHGKHHSDKDHDKDHDKDSHKHSDKDSHDKDSHKHSDKHSKHSDKHSDKHSKHSKHSLADIDEMNDEFDEGLYFSRSERAVDEVVDTADGTHSQSTWSWFGMVALFLIGAVVSLVVLYWMAACVVAYLHRRRYRQLEQTKSGWADEEAMGLTNYSTA